MGKKLKEMIESYFITWHYSDAEIIEALEEMKVWCDENIKSSGKLNELELQWKKVKISLSQHSFQRRRN